MTATQNAASIVPINDATLMRFAIIRGLKPGIRLHVLQTGATTLDDVIRAARVAEAAVSASEPTDEVSQLTAQVNQLLAKLATKPVVAVVDDTDARRRVTFSPPDGVEEGRRSPTTSPMSPYRTRSPVDTQQRRPTHQLSRPGPSYNRSAPPTRRYNDDDRRQQVNDGPQRQQAERQYGRSRDSSRTMWTPACGARPSQQRTQSWHPQGNGERRPEFSDNQPRLSHGNSNWGNCGRAHDNVYGACFAAKLTCYRCQRIGHISRFCRSAPRPAINSSY